MSYNRRKGIDWQNELYHKLLTFVNNNNIKIDENCYKNLSNQHMDNLSIAVFPKNGNRNAYREKVSFFLKCYFQTIIEDLPKVSNDQIVNAPKLQQWFDYKMELCRALCSSSIREDIQKFLIDVDYKLPLSIRTKVLCDMYQINENDIMPWMMKKLGNCLWFNRNEICVDLYLAISSNVLSNDNMHKNQFHGFTEKENNSSSIEQTKFLNMISLESEVKDKVLVKETSYVELVENINEDSNHSIVADNKLRLVAPKRKNYDPKNSLKKNFKKKVTLMDQITKPILELFSAKEDNNDQVIIFKKLVILNLVSLNNRALKSYMQGAGRVSRNTKKTILESLFDENVKESHYSVLDLLILKRYVIKEKVDEINDLFERNKINFSEEIEGMEYYDDLEQKLYEEHATRDFNVHIFSLNKSKS